EPCDVARRQEVERRPEQHLDDQAEIEGDVERQRADGEHGRRIRKLSCACWLHQPDAKGNARPAAAAACFRQGRHRAACESACAVAWRACISGSSPRTTAARYLAYSVNSTRSAARLPTHSPL